MKLAHTLALAGLGVGTLGIIAVTQGCSSSSPAGTAADAGATTSTAAVGGPPMAPAGTPATTITTAHNYALKKIYLGDTDRTGVASPNAWKNFGYNVDGKVTSSSSTDVCTLVMGAPKGTQADGTNGIDNSFGANILPIITTASAGAAASINTAITEGHFTLMIDVTGLDDSNPAQTATGLTGFLNAGGAFSGPDGGASPTFTTADNWPVLPTLLANPMDPKSSTVKFPQAYVVGGTFVNGSPATVTLSLEVGGVGISIVINQATISFDHKSAGSATNGTIAGVINSTDFIAQLKMVAGRISSTLCTGPSFQSIANQINEASDIMADGSNAPGATCNGISIGIGFDAAEIGPPSIVGALAPASPDPCATDAGTADGG